MKRRHALYPGTFDPVTLGHLDILQRSLSLFDQVTVAVARASRAGLFPVEQRVSLLADAVQDQPRCHVVAFDGLLMDQARRLRADCIVRGIRSLADLENERSQAGMNVVLYPACEYVFLLARPDLIAVSSSLVREIAGHGGDVSPFVPPHVAAALQESFQRKRS
jgi:pantetheine-phosphate adenylyltransferase